MSLSELVSTLTPSTGAQVGVVVFFAVFALICVRLWSRRQRVVLDEAAALPLVDDDPPIAARADATASDRGDQR